MKKVNLTFIKKYVIIKKRTFLPIGKFSFKQMIRHMRIPDRPCGGIGFSGELEAI